MYCGEHLAELRCGGALRDFGGGDGDVGDGGNYYFPRCFRADYGQRWGDCGDEWDAERGAGDYGRP